MQGFEFKPGKWLTVATFIALVILMSLGTWQWRKIETKNAWIAQIEAGLGAAPVSIDQLDLNDPNLPYRRISVAGAFKPGSSLRMFGTNTSGRSGYHHYGLFEAANGDDYITSLGWLPFESEDSIEDWPPVGEYSAVLLPPGTKGGFTPDNDRAGNVWYWADLRAMAQALGAETPVLTYRLILDDIATEGMPKGGQVRVDIPNDHFEYALTWYGLALTLIGVYGFFGLKRRDSLS